MNTTKNPPFGDQDLAFQTHALQMILFGPFYVRTQHCYGSLQNRVLTFIIIIILSKKYLLLLLLLTDLNPSDLFAYQIIYHY